MKQNAIEGSGLVIYRARILKDPNKVNSHLNLLINDEYIKSMNYQKRIKEDGCFYVGGNILYLLLSELFDHITVMFNKIRMDDVNINDENSTLLFLRKFSRSSETIEAKIQQTMNRPQGSEYEVFEIRLAGLQNNIAFSREAGKNAKMCIAVPVSYLYNRLISYMDKMRYSDIPHLDEEIRNTFLERFDGLNRKVKDKKQQIEVKYALELAQERIHDLEDENAELHQRILQTDSETQLYKRSYLLLKKRFDNLCKRVKKTECAGNGEQSIDEL